MTIEDIRGYRNARPFHPFDVVMRDGTVVHVELAERMALSRSGRMAYVFEGSDLSFLDVSQVVELKPNRTPHWMQQRR